LLPAVAVELLGPPAPTSLDAISNQQLLWRLAVPSLIAAFGQLAATHLVLRGNATPREALAAALAAFPAYALAQVSGSLPVGLGLLLLLVPGLWLFARLLFLSGAVVLAEGGTPFALLRRSWVLSEGQGLQLTLFLVLGLFGVIGIGILAEGAGAALDVVARTGGLASVGRFLHALVPAIGNCLVTIGVGGASAAAYRQLAAPLR
ncbi:MAG: hypothetical protein NBV62_14200, partial [Sandarakinorhabdus limnophila]